MLNQSSNLTSFARPIAESIHTFKRIGQIHNNGQLTSLRHRGFCKSNTCIFNRVNQRKLATPLCLSTEGSTTKYNS